VNKDGELCKRSFFGYPWGRIGRGVLTFSDRPQPWLYFWQKYKLTPIGVLLKNKLAGVKDCVIACMCKLKVNFGDYPYLEGRYGRVV